MKYAYYPGCSLHSTSREFDSSTRGMAKILGIELIEIPDWICCGATPAHSTQQLLSLALPAKNLLMAKRMDSLEVAVCCPACYGRLKTANKKLSLDMQLREKVGQILGEEYRGEIKVRYILDILINSYGIEKIAKKVSRRLKGLKAACYYGCLLTRPPEITELDDLEDPQMMDNLMKALGAETVNWPFKTDCCGANFSLTKTEIVLKLTHDIYEMASLTGAQAFIVSCPLCQSNLDLRQKRINKEFKANFSFPVIYITQAIGLALGLDEGSLGFNRHLIDPRPLLKKLALI